MKIIETRIPGVILLEPSVYRDERGYFMETWNQKRYADVGLSHPFVQDNLSCSRRNVLRGLHFQEPAPQGKLVSVPMGAVFDVAVDLRPESPTYGDWLGAELTSENMRQLYIPEGCAHGFVVTSEIALFSYKCTAFYAPQYERGLRWNDPDIAIEWPVDHPLLSEKDADAPFLRDLLRC